MRGSPLGSADQHLPVDALVARIVDRHHAYVRRLLPALAPLVARVAEVHGAHEPRLVELRSHFETLCARLVAALDEEEQGIFSLLVAGVAEPAAIASAADRMAATDAELRGALDRLRALTDAYTPPPWACRSYRLALAQLEDLASDLQDHLDLEAAELLPRLAGRPSTPQPPPRAARSRR